MERSDPREPSDLVYDVGAHQGEDTAFYLAKGFRVVAVEAVPEFCADISRATDASGLQDRLIVENVAVGAGTGPVTFYTSSNSVWGTTQQSWVERNRSLGAESPSVLTVPGASLRSLIEKHGPARYVKIDIEGADLEALRSLIGIQERPIFVSIESEKIHWRRLLAEFTVLRRLGYDRFKIVNQQFISEQPVPQPSREGRFVPGPRPAGSSGVFGADLSGRWMRRSEALLRYGLLFVRYAINGDGGVVWRMPKPQLCFRVSRRLVGESGWFDTHATTASTISTTPR